MKPVLGEGAMKFCLQFVVCVVLLIGCGQSRAVSESDARAMADDALHGFCERRANFCENLSFTGSTKSDDNWLVEYRSDSYLLAVTVNKDRTTEISHFREDRN